MPNEGLADAVRNWVHFDNVYATLSRQISTARNMRANFEEKILSQLGATKRLKIQGAMLEPATRKNSVSLNWGSLEESLHKYYSAQKRTDETDAVLKFIKENREIKTSTYLKKTPLVDLPAPALSDK